MEMEKLCISHFQQYQGFEEGIHLEVVLFFYDDLARKDHELFEQSQ